MTNPVETASAAKNLREQSFVRPNISRRSYRKPQLSLLGTVRDRTQGASGPHDDGGGFSPIEPGGE